MDEQNTIPVEPINTNPQPEPQTVEQPVQNLQQPETEQYRYEGDAQMAAYSPPIPMEQSNKGKIFKYFLILVLIIFGLGSGFYIYKNKSININASMITALFKKGSNGEVFTDEDKKEYINKLI